MREGEASTQPEHVGAEERGSGEQQEQHGQLGRYAPQDSGSPGVADSGSHPFYQYVVGVLTLNNYQHADDHIDDWDAMPLRDDMGDSEVRLGQIARGQGHHEQPGRRSPG